jgi:hypothetical protein
MSQRNPILFAELKARLDQMTPEQLAMPVYWVGEDRGAPIVGLEMLNEDHINPSGDGMEPLSAYADDEDFEAIKAEQPVVARKGQLLLLVDG